MDGPLRGRVASVLIGLHPLVATLEEKKASLDGSYLVTTRKPEVRVTMEGFEGDRHAGMTQLATGHTPRYARGTVIRTTRQASIVSVEELERVAAAMRLPRILPEWLGANLCLEGVPSLTRLPPGTRLSFSHETVLVVEGENKPCVYPGRAIQHQYPETPGLAQAFPKAARHLRGVVAWVERPGTIHEGDAVVVEVPRLWFGAPYSETSPQPAVFPGIDGGAPAG